jgi:exopolyphosphatase/guanosine-5'-triphosphate,3'-diphosphate pyrophosphatase
MGETRGSDLTLVASQLGREPTTPFSVVARCPGGHPLVIRNRPFDAAGDPFPTLFWLTCPDAVRAVSRLEAEGAIAMWNARADAEPALAAALARAHDEYARERARDAEGSQAFGGVGGTAHGVKCLHAHYANHLGGGADLVGAWVAERVEPVHADERRGRVGVVDLGTNSIRLLVASAAPDGSPDGSLEEFARDMVITRIGAGVHATGRIDPAALERTLGVLTRYCARARVLHAERIAVSATSAVRDASNRTGLEAAVERLAGEPLRVIDGEHEARLSFDGATRGLHEASPFLVVDVGGGSTELALGVGDVDAAISLPVGSVRLTERFVRSDPPTAKELDAVRAEVRARLAEAEAVVAGREAATLVAVAGTATTVQGVALGLERWDPEATHRTSLSLDDARAVVSRLASMTNAERASIPVMPPGRADVITAGAVVLTEAIAVFGHDRALVSETDILDGLAFEALRTR